MHILAFCGLSDYISMGLFPLRQGVSQAGSSYSRARLTVKDHDPRPPPIIHQGPQNQTLPIDSVAMLRCASSGDPRPSISWLKDNRLLSMSDDRITQLGSGTLQISGKFVKEILRYSVHCRRKW